MTTTGVSTEIMLVEYADVVNSEHGWATLVVNLISQGKEQAFLLAPERAYDILKLFEVNRLSKCAGKPVMVHRDTTDNIVRLSRLECYEPFAVGA